MTYERMETLLSKKAVDGMRDALEHAFIRSRQVPEGPLALAELLTALLASVIAVPGEQGDALARARYCCDRLIEIAGVMEQSAPVGVPHPSTPLIDERWVH